MIAKPKSSLEKTQPLDDDTNTNNFEIHAGILFLEEDPLLHMAARSIEPFVDEIHFQQQRYETFPDPEGRYANVPVMKDEIEARNLLLSAIPNQTYYLIVDSDEIFYGNWEHTRWKLNFYHPKMAWVRHICQNNRVIKRPRFLWKHRDVEYRENHTTLWDGEEWLMGKRVTKDRVEVPLSFLHLPHLRDNYYKDANWEHYTNREETKDVRPPAQRITEESPYWLWKQPSAIKDKLDMLPYTQQRRKERQAIYNFEREQARLREEREHT